MMRWGHGHVGECARLKAERDQARAERDDLEARLRRAEEQSTWLAARVEAAVDLLAREMWFAEQRAEAGLASYGPWIRDELLSATYEHFAQAAQRELDWRDLPGEAVIGGGINSGECVGREASRTPIAFRDVLLRLAAAATTTAPQSSPDVASPAGPAVLDTTPAPNEPGAEEARWRTLPSESLSEPLATADPGSLSADTMVFWVLLGFASILATVYCGAVGDWVGFVAALGMAASAQFMLGTGLFLRWPRARLLVRLGARDQDKP